MSQNAVLVSFFGGLLAGEEVIITLAFLSARGILSLWVVFVFCFAGILICDSFFFFIGKIKFLGKLKKISRLHITYKKIEKIVNKITGDKIILALFYTKFIFGTRIATLIYLGRKNSFKKFIFADFIVGIMWMSVVVSLGWFAGASFYFIIDVFKNIQFAILFLVMFIIFLLLLKKWVAHQLIKRQKLLN